jgi:phosphoadenosine phosphosulfate reductase
VANPIKNIDAFKVCKSAARKCGRFILMLSAGRDSAVMLNILRKYIEPENLICVHLYHFQPLYSFHKKYFAMIEKRYGIKMHYYPHHDMQVDVKSRHRTRKLKQIDTENFLRNKFDCKWISWGMRKDESLERRGMMAHLDEGIDFKYGRIYPLMDWTAPRIRNYVSNNIIPLSVEYSFDGMRDMNRLKGETVAWLKTHYPDDFYAIVKNHPNVMAELVRYESEDNF